MEKEPGKCEKTTRWWKAREGIERDMHENGATYLDKNSDQ